MYKVLCIIMLTQVNTIQHIIFEKVEKVACIWFYDAALRLSYLQQHWSFYLAI